MLSMIALSLLIACGDSDEKPCADGFGRAADGNCYPLADTDSDTDADSDTDSDADSDMDTDTDSDTDMDTDTDSDTPNLGVLEMDGGNDYVWVEGVEGLGGDELTIEAWVRYDQTDDINQSILAYRDPSAGLQDGFTFRIRNGADDALEFGFANGSTDYGISGETPLSVGAWAHAAATYDRSTGAMTLYLNGELDGQGTATIEAATGAFPLWMGADPYHGTTGRTFGGAVDEVRIWDRVRSEEEIAGDMATVLSGTESGLLLYWTMEDGSGQVLTDHSGNGWYGTLGSSAGTDSTDPTWGTDVPFP